MTTPESTRTTTSTTSSTGSRVPAPRTAGDGGGGSSGAVEWLTAVLAAAGLHRAGGKWQCPAHGHTGVHSAALALGYRDDGAGAWVHCHAGCTVTAVMKRPRPGPGASAAPSAGHSRPLRRTAGATPGVARAAGRRGIDPGRGGVPARELA